MSGRSNGTGQLQTRLGPFARFVQIGLLQLCLDGHICVTQYLAQATSQQLKPGVSTNAMQQDTEPQEVTVVYQEETIEITEEAPVNGSGVQAVTEALADGLGLNDLAEQEEPEIGLCTHRSYSVLPNTDSTKCL